MNESTQFKLLGKQVFLRHFTLTDISSDYIAWLNDPTVVRYSNQRFKKHTKTSCHSYLESFENTSNLFLSIHMQSDGLAVGTMTAYKSDPHGTVDIGIMVGRSSVWGSGVGYDAWNTLLSWFLAKPNIRKVTAGAMRANTAMIRIMERSGMMLESIRFKQELLDGVPQDLLYYAKFSNR